jgi:uncharacterized protein YggE
MRRAHFAAIGLAGLLVLATAGAVVGGLGTAGAATPEEAPADRTITVSATGGADASPDQAVVRVAVTAAGDDPAAVRDTLESGAADLRDSLDEVGAAYETTRFSIDERRRPPRESEQDDRPTYRGAHRFTVTVDDPGDAGDVIDAAAEAGAEVSNVELGLSDERRTELRSDAVENAMADARAQAETIAAASDLSVTGVATVDAQQRRHRPVAFEAGGGDGASASTIIDSGEVSVTYGVQVTFNATAQ